MAESPARVLLVDDDPQIRDLLTSVLNFAGFAVDAAADATQARRHLSTGGIDAVVLDVMMPGEDGFALLQSIRATDRHTPVLFLTARDAVEDRVRGLATGADDYVTKPFSMVEVEARLRALLRRSQLAAPAAHDAHHDDVEPVLECGDLVVDEDRHTVQRAGVVIDLSPTEYRLLTFLMTNKERVVSKAQILDRVWQYDFGGDARVVERFVSNLRRKIDDHGAPLIHTIRGFGYTIRPPDPARGE